MSALQLINLGTVPLNGTDGDTNRAGNTKVNALLAPLIGATGTFAVTAGVPSVNSPALIPSVVNSKNLTIFYIQAGFLLPVIPTLSSATPNSGYSGAGNVPVLLQGTGLQTTTSVMFNGVAAKWFNATSDTQIWCMPQPTTTVGSVTITVTTANATGVAGHSATTSFTFLSVGIAGTASIFLQSNSSAAATSGEFAALGPDLNVWMASHRAIVESPFVQRQIQILSNLTIGLVVPVSSGPFHNCNAVAGPDGNLWTASEDGYAWKIPTNGDTPTKYKMSLANAVSNDPGQIYPRRACVYDGCIWFAGISDNANTWYLWRCTTAGDVTAFVYPNTLYKFIFQGTDGLLWAVDNPMTGTTLGFYKINPYGTMSLVGFFQYAPSPVGGIFDATLGPDGNIWVVSSDINQSPAPAYIGKVSPTNLAGAQTLTAGLPNNSQTTAIMAGPDGNMWVPTVQVGTSDSLLLKITTSLTLAASVDMTGGLAQSLLPNSGTVGADGALYFPCANLPRTNSGYFKVV